MLLFHNGKIIFFHNVDNILKQEKYFYTFKRAVDDEQRNLIGRFYGGFSFRGKIIIEAKYDLEKYRGKNRERFAIFESFAKHIVIPTSTYEIAEYMKKCINSFDFGNKIITDTHKKLMIEAIEESLGNIDPAEFNLHILTALANEVECTKIDELKERFKHIIQTN
jgi:hypothetical protein